MKQAIALLLAVYMLLAVLAGCTAKTTTDAEPAPSTTEQETSSETQTPAEAEQAGPVELGLMLWEASEAETEPIDRGIKNYEEASGNKVTKSTVAWSEYHGKLRTLMAADNAPDVFWLNPEYQIDFILDGQICDLTELVNTAYNWDDFIPASQQKMMYTDANGESHIYGVDVCDVGTMFFYNVDMFEEAGYAQEDMPLTKEDMWTWDEFIQIMQDVTQYDEQGNVTVYGTTNFEEPMSLYSTLEMLTSAGANWFNDDFTEEEMKELCPLASFGLFSCGHCETGEAARAVLRRACSFGCGTAVATLGAEGSLVLAGGQFYTEPALPVQAVDTMGAGDSFWAAFLVNWFKDVQTHGAPDVQGAMRAASAFAGKNVCRRGSLGFGMPADLAALGEIRPL